MGTESETVKGEFDYMKTISFKLNPESKSKLHFQLFQKLADLIKNGEYAPDSKLPSVRKMSDELSVSRNTVIASYKMLEEEGYVTSYPKRGYIVSTSISGVKLPVNEEQADEDSDIPTVDSIIKQREGSDVQKIPLPTDFEQEIELAAKTVPEVDKSVPIKQEQTIENTSISVKKPTETSFTQSVPTEVQTSQENQPVPEVVESATKESVPTKEPLTQQIQALTPKKQFCKKIAIDLYEKRKISCTASQIVLGASEDELIEKTLNILYPQATIQTEGKGLLKLAEAATEGTLRKRQGTLAIESNFPKEKLNSFESLKSLNIETAFIPSDENGISIEELNSSNAKVVLVCPLLWTADKIPEPQQTESDDEDNEAVDEDEEKIIDLRDNISECRKNLLNWANENPDRYIIEYEKNNLEENKIPALHFFDKNQKVIYISSTAENNCFIILPAPLHKQFQ